MLGNYVCFLCLDDTHLPYENPSGSDLAVCVSNHNGKLMTKPSKNLPHLDLINNVKA